MSKDLYSEISAHFGINSVENLVGNRRNRFINRHVETDIIYVNCCADRFACLGVFLIRLFNFCFAEFIHLFCVRLPYKMAK